MKWFRLYGLSSVWLMKMREKSSLLFWCGLFPTVRFEQGVKCITSQNSTYNVSFNRRNEMKYSPLTVSLFIWTSQTHAHDCPTWKQKCWTANGCQILNIHLNFIYKLCVGCMCCVATTCVRTWEEKSWPHQPSSISCWIKSNFMLLCEADSLKLLFELVAYMQKNIQFISERISEVNMIFQGAHQRSHVAHWNGPNYYKS